MNYIYTELHLKCMTVFSMHLCLEVLGILAHHMSQKNAAIQLEKFKWVSGIQVQENMFFHFKPLPETFYYKKHKNSWKKLTL